MIVMKQALKPLAADGSERAAASTRVPFLSFAINQRTSHLF
ncbi:hypothetical protein [Paenibacillus aquistagni]|nr:hypothetical protein [Paenibacillus aquistagni]